MDDLPAQYDINDIAHLDRDQSADTDENAPAPEAQRLWRSVKYEEVYLRAYDSVAEARPSIGRYLAFFNEKRPHSSLDRQTPDEAYFANLPLSVAA